MSANNPFEVTRQAAPQLAVAAWMTACRACQLNRWTPMARTLLLGFSLLVLCACTFSVNGEASSKLPPVVEGTAEQRNEASKAAMAIVRSIDQGEYSAVWRNSGKTLKEGSSEFVFTNLLKMTRGNLGKPDPRKTYQIGFTSKVDPNLPEGEYCVFTTDTGFSGSVVTEKVVMQRTLGAWKLVGYFVSSKTAFGS